MNLYSIHFSGHEPVGAVAVTMAASEEEAKLNFLEQLIAEEPELYEDYYSPSRPYANPGPTSLVITQLTFTPELNTHILLNGEY